MYSDCDDDLADLIDADLMLETDPSPNLKHNSLRLQINSTPKASLIPRANKNGSSPLAQSSKPSSLLITSQISDCHSCKLMLATITHLSSMVKEANAKLDNLQSKIISHDSLIHKMEQQLSDANTKKADEGKEFFVQSDTIQEAHSLKLDQIMNSVQQNEIVNCSLKEIVDKQSNQLIEIIERQQSIDLLLDPTTEKKKTAPNITLDRTTAATLHTTGI